MDEIKHNVLWRGRPPQSINQRTYWIGALTFWCIIPLWIAWKRYRQTQTTEYIVDAHYVHIRNDQYYECNQVLELYRVQRIEIEPLPNGQNDVVFVPNNQYTPAVRFRSVDFDASDRERILSSMDNLQETQRVQEISIPILQ